MAGQGPPPKDPKRRARTNSDRVATRVLPASLAAQPRLPTAMPGGDPWPSMTRAWWRMWGKSPLAKTFTATDWSELRDAAVLHGQYWSGNVKIAAELRLRMAQFGATPESRARLRISFADAEVKETTARRGPAAPPAGAASKSRYKGLSVVKPATAG